MPSYSATGYGAYTQVIPPNAINVSYTIAGAAGGDSKRDPPGSTWNQIGGFGRVGNMTLDSVNFQYTLTFYCGGRGGAGYGTQGPGNPGGGGPSYFANGGAGYSAGGGGGGASGVVHSGGNGWGSKWIVVCGGGGGAARQMNNSGQYAGLGLQGGTTTGTLYSQTGESAPAGNTGGGGGGSTFGVGTGTFAGRAGYPYSGGGHYGHGGNSAWLNDYLGGGHMFHYPGYANYGEGYYSLSWDYGAPIFLSINPNPAQVVLGNTVDLQWTTSGEITYTYIGSNATDPGNVGGANVLSGTATVSPTVIPTTTYTGTSYGPGGASNQVTANVTVYEMPTVTITADHTTITLGESAEISWSTTGTANTANFNPGVGSVPISSSQTVSPTTDTTYTIDVSASGEPYASAGLDTVLVDSDTITITVLQPPSGTLSGPATIPWEAKPTLQYTGTNVITSFTLSHRYYYVDDTVTSWQTTEVLNTGSTVSGSHEHDIVYNDSTPHGFGPKYVEYRLSGVGSGSLTFEEFHTVNINIDITPDPFSIPATENLLPDIDVITPDSGVISGGDVTVTDIDIPVKIKSNQPIKVEIDESGIWLDVTEI